MKKRMYRYYVVARNTYQTYQDLPQGIFHAFPESVTCPEGRYLVADGYIDLKAPLSPEEAKRRHLAYHEDFPWGPSDDGWHHEGRINLLGHIRYEEYLTKKYPKANPPYYLLEKIADRFRNHYISAADFFDLTAQVKHLFV